MMETRFQRLLDAPDPVLSDGAGWMIKIGIATLVAMISMTVLGAWLVYVARLKNPPKVSEDDNLDGVSNPASPVAIHSTTQSVLWRITRTQPQQSSLKKMKAQDRSRGKFEIIGDDDDSDNEDQHQESIQETSSHSESESLAVKSLDLDMEE